MDAHRPTLSPRLLHVEEAARLLAVGRTKAYELIANGDLHAIHLGRATRISEAELERFIRGLDRPGNDHYPQASTRVDETPEARNTVN